MTIFALAASLCVCGTASAAPARVTISGAWFRALPSKLPDGGYFTLRNDGETKITLTGASTPACGMLMLHKSSDMGGMMTMGDVESVDVQPHGTLAFAPGGYHLMCMQPSAAIKPGGTVPVTLTFADGSSAKAAFAVRNAAGK